MRTDFFSILVCATINGCADRSCRWYGRKVQMCTTRSQSDRIEQKLSLVANRDCVQDEKQCASNDSCQMSRVRVG